MSWEHILVIISSLIIISGASAYIRDTLRGKTKPNLVTWSMWTLAPLIGAAAAISAHADPWVVVRIFLAGFLPLLVLISAFINPQSHWKITVFDILCGLCSILALGIWLIIDSPVYAILLAAIGDGFAALPTIIKAWKFPETETVFTYIMSLFSVLLVIPSIPHWNIENSAFQVYLILVNLILIAVVFRKRLKFW